MLRSKPLLIYRDELKSKRELMSIGMDVLLGTSLLSLIFGLVYRFLGIDISPIATRPLVAAIAFSLLLPALVVVMRRYRQIASFSRCLIVATGFSWLPLLIVAQELFKNKNAWDASYDFPLPYIVLVSMPCSVLTVFGFCFIIRGPVHVIERNQCIMCGYRIEGNESGRCSECGEAIQAEPIH